MFTNFHQEVGRDETKEGDPPQTATRTPTKGLVGTVKTSRHMSRRPRVEARAIVRRDSEEQARMRRQMRGSPQHRRVWSYHKGTQCWDLKQDSDMGGVRKNGPAVGGSWSQTCQRQDRAPESTDATRGECSPSPYLGQVLGRDTPSHRRS